MYHASPAPDASSGLPAAHLSRPPGMPESEARIVGLAHDGWLGPPGSAMLVQVSTASARLLMTLYQVGDGPVPQLQITRLGDEPGAGISQPPRAAASAGG